MKTENPYSPYVIVHTVRDSSFSLENSSHSVQLPWVSYWNFHVRTGLMGVLSLLTS